MQRQVGARRKVARTKMLPAFMTIDVTEATTSEVEGERLSASADKGRWIQVIGVYVALAVLWVVFSFIAPYFLTVQNVLNLFDDRLDTGADRGSG